MREPGARGEAVEEEEEQRWEEGIEERRRAVWEKEYRTKTS